MIQIQTKQIRQTEFSNNFTMVESAFHVACNLVSKNIFDQKQGTYEKPILAGDKIKVRVTSHAGNKRTYFFIVEKIKDSTYIKRIKNKRSN